MDEADERSWDDVMAGVRAHVETELLAGVPDVVRRPRTAVAVPKLAAVAAAVAECRRCAIAAKRRNSVPGTGNPEAELMFVGEAPGEDEDRQGLPFVGRAGQLLTDMIVAMKLRREDVFIANILKCRPPGNRNPDPGEIENCIGYLREQIRAVRPRVICVLGRIAAQALLRTDTAISALRGRVFDWEGIPLVPTFHPAYLLRNPADKKLVWSDLKKVLSLLGRPAS